MPDEHHEIDDCGSVRRPIACPGGDTIEELNYAAKSGLGGLKIEQFVAVLLSLALIPAILFMFSGLLFVRSGIGMPGLELYLVCGYLGIPFIIFSLYVISVVRKLRRRGLSCRWPLLCLLLDWLVFGGCYVAVQIKYFW